MPWVTERRPGPLTDLIGPYQNPHTRTSDATRPPTPGPSPLSARQNWTPRETSSARSSPASAASLLTACGSLPDGGPSRKTVTVWLMKDSASKDFLKRFTEDFEQKHDAIRLDVRIQEWTGIGDKVQAALKRSDADAPDVIEVGNTQVAQYVDGGGLSDLTLESMRDWGMNDWLPGLAEPGTVRHPAVRRPLVRRQPGGHLPQGPVPGRRRRAAAEDPRGVAHRHRTPQHRREPGHLPGRPGLVHAVRLHLGRGRRPRREVALGELGGHPRDTGRAARHGLLPAASRPSATAPWTPTRNTRRRPGCSPRAGSPRSWRCPGSPRRSSGPTPPSRASSGSSPFPARPPASPVRSSPAAPTWSCRRTPTTATGPLPSSRPSRAPSGRRTSPGR